MVLFVYVFSFKALVRDHHPRDFLFNPEYEQLRKKGCKVLKFRYREEPEIEPGEIVKTSKPEDKLMAHVKEKILIKLEKTHKKTVEEADKRWDYEDRVSHSIVVLITIILCIFIFCNLNRLLLRLKRKTYFLSFFNSYRLKGLISIQNLWIKVNSGTGKTI